MPYATSTDISSEFKGIDFGSATTVTAAEVAQFIEQEEAVINAAVSNRYEIPITGTGSLKILKSISIAYVAWRVAEILNLKKDVPFPEKFVPQTLNKGAKFKLAKERLMAIRDGGMILPDAVELPGGHGVSSYNSDNNICPVFERDKEQW